MRVRFRIQLYEGDKRLRKQDLFDRKDAFGVGIRYITEFKYLEATKWLLLAPDSWEKYVLLSLINLSLGQVEQAQEFLEMAVGFEREKELRIEVSFPERGKSIEINDLPDVMPLFAQTPPG